MHFNIFQNRMRSMHSIVKNRYFSKFQIPIAQTKASHDFQQRPISVATQKAANVFELLPQDILTYHIFQHLGDQDLISTGLTNKHFNQLSRDPHLKGLQMLFQAKLVNLEQEERLKFLKTPKAQDILKVIPTLCLSYTTLTDDDLNEILAILPESNNIRELNLMGNSIGNAGALAIATSQKICQLTKLNLGKNHIGPEGANDLANSPYLKQLTELNLNRNYVGFAGAAELVKSTKLTKLTKLNLEFNQIFKELKETIKAYANQRGLSVDF